MTNEVNQDKLFSDEIEFAEDGRPMFPIYCAHCGHLALKGTEDLTAAFECVNCGINLIIHIEDENNKIVVSRSKPLDEDEDIFDYVRSIAAKIK